jgi:hypothetical protein
LAPHLLSTRDDFAFIDQVAIFDEAKLTDEEVVGFAEEVELLS